MFMLCSLSNGNRHFFYQLILMSSSWNKHPTSLTLPFRKIRLTNFRKIDTFQSGIPRVVVQIFLDFQEEKAWGQKETFVKYRQSQG